MITGAVLIILGISFFAYLYSSLYGLNSQISFDKNILLQKTSKISLYDNNDEFIETASITDPIVKLDQLPNYVKDAFIAVEDKNFYSHNGLNTKRIVKALFTNLTNGYAKEGASTISQQLVKNIYLNSEKTYDRKIKEILLTLKLEKEFTKDQILEAYLNVIYFGNSSYGIESASKTYFNKKAKDLTLPETASLVATIKSPLNYSPFFNLQNNESRKNLVLRQMYNDGYISKTEYALAVTTPVTLTLKDIEFSARRIYEKAAIEEASKILNLSEKDVATSGLKVFTYMDRNLQQNLEKLVLNKNYYHENEYGNIADSAAVTIDNKTGGINAFYGKSKYDIVNMKRSPASAIKPILVYAPALEYGKICPTTPILDETININNYSPSNVSDKYYGWVTTRETVEKSLNIPAIKILQYVGIDKAKEIAKKAGITFNEKDAGYSIALGGFTDGVTLTELTNSYLPFANNGEYIKAGFVKKIQDTDGRILYNRKIDKTKVISKETAYLMTDMLKSGVKKGTSQRLNTLDFEVAGKTGTVGLNSTNNNSDAISIAYTKDKSVGVWLGNSTGEQENQLNPANNGGTYATSLLRDILKVANKQENEAFEMPSGITTKKIDLIELKENNKVMLANENTPEMYTKTEVFNKKFLPTKTSTSFTSLDKPKLNLTVKNNTSILCFNANSYVIYELYKIEEDQTKLLKTVKNKSGKITVKDDDLEEQSMYAYYLIAKQVNNVTNKTITSSKSDPVKVYLNNNENQATEGFEDEENEKTIKKQKQSFTDLFKKITKPKTTQNKKKMFNWF